jgi:putative transposase
VIARLNTFLQVLTDLAGIVPLAVRRQGALAAEILMLRRQLAMYVERGVKPRRVDPVTRVSLALLSRFFNWRDALVVLRPETMIRWHPGGLAAVLAPKVSTRPTAYPQGSTRTDPPHGEGESYVG